MFFIKQLQLKFLFSFQLMVNLWFCLIFISRLHINGKKKRRNIVRLFVRAQDSHANLIARSRKQYTSLTCGSIRFLIRDSAVYNIMKVKKKQKSASEMTRQTQRRLCALIRLVHKLSAHFQLAIRIMHNLSIYIKINNARWRSRRLTSTSFISVCRSVSFFPFFRFIFFLSLGAINSLQNIPVVDRYICAWLRSCA